MHPLLQRQILKHLKSLEVLPKDQGWNDLFKSIGDTYSHYDTDRKLIERSLEISSKELNENNQQLQSRLIDIQQKTTELEKLNNMMIDREIKMVELKEEISALKTKLSQTKP